MKKLFTLVLFVFCSFIAFSQAPDLEIRILSPKNGDTVNRLAAKNFTFEITNTGQVDLGPQDSIVVTLRQNNLPVMGFLRLINFGNNLPKGSSVTTSQNFAFFNQEKNLSHCFVVNVIKNGKNIDSVATTNNISCVLLQIFPAVSVEEDSKENFSQLYPNPASNFVTVNNSHPQAAFAMVTDITGKEITKIALTNGFATLPLDVAAGLYFCHITTAANHKLSTQKFYVIK